MTTYTGMVHVHSTCSYDGQHSLDALVQEAKRRGYRFLGMSEHSDTLDSDRVAEFVAACNRVSSSDCLVIPGIEFTCKDKLHLLGFGVREFIVSDNPVEVSRFIHDRGGVAVVAHPRRYGYQIPPELVSELDGIEVWNAGYDGRFVPDTNALSLLQDLRKRNPSLLGFGGQDLHRLANHDYIGLSIGAAELSHASVLEALRQGNFSIQGPLWTIDAKRELKPGLAALLSVNRYLFDVGRSVRAALQQ